VLIKEGGYISPTATGLIGGALGVLVGVSLMTVRELGRQQRRHEAKPPVSREE
jgi:hydrogenase small subunit